MAVLRVLAFAALLTVLVALPCSVLAKPMTNSVAAKVGNISIYEQDVALELQKILPLQVSFHGGIKQEQIDKARNEALQNLIDRAYKVQFAISEEIAVDPQVVAKEWQAYKSKNSSSLSQMSAKQVEWLRANMYLKLLAEKAEDVAVESQIDVSEESVKSYYDQNKHRYLKPKSFTASHVFVRVSPSANKEEQAEKEARAKDLMQRAEAGEDFYNLAYYESDDRSKYVGGSLGTFHKGQTVAEFEDAVISMQPGEVKGPVRTMYGFHIIKLDAVEEERQLKYEEASISIRAKMEDDKRKSLYEEWMATLVEKFPVERSDQ